MSSSDGYTKPDPKSLRKKGGLNSGGQNGHPGSALLLADKPDSLILHRLKRCPCGCGASLRHQPVLRYYLKSTRGKKTPDFLVEEDGKEFVMEAGGRGKGRSQFKEYRAESKLILCHSSDTVGIKKPLFMLGFSSDPV